MTDSTMATATPATAPSASVAVRALESRHHKLTELRSVFTERRFKVSERKSTEMEKFARQKTGETVGHSRLINAWIVLFDSTRAGRKTSREYAILTKRIDSLTAALRLIEGRIEAIGEVAAAKAAEKRKLADFNESIKSRRVYSFSQRRRSSWGRVQTFHSIDSHSIKKLPDGRFVVDKHTHGYDVVYIYRPSDAKHRVESRGDVFVTGPSAEIAPADVIKILAKPPKPTYPTEVDWKTKYEKQFELRDAFEKYSKILERKADPRNKYARWLASLGACNNGICLAMRCDPRTPHDTIRAGNAAEIAYLRNHAILKTSGGSPKLFELTEELCTFPSWETFE